MVRTSSQLAHDFERIRTASRTMHSPSLATRNSQLEPALGCWRQPDRRDPILDKTGILAR